MILISQTLIYYYTISSFVLHSFVSYSILSLDWDYLGQWYPHINSSPNSNLRTSISSHVKILRIQGMNLLGVQFSFYD